jgi:hypothetical protein
MSRVLRMSLGCLLAIAIVASPAVAASSVVKASSGPLTATLSPPPHSPKVGSKPPITVTATLNGKPAKQATAFYEFLFAGQVVSTQYIRGNKHFTFNGHFGDTLGPFPATAAGQPLTFRVVVKAGGRTVNLNWALSVVQ